MAPHAAQLVQSSGVSVTFLLFWLSNSLFPSITRTHPFPTSTYQCTSRGLIGALCHGKLQPTAGTTFRIGLYWPDVIPTLCLASGSSIATTLFFSHVASPSHVCLTTKSPKRRFELFAPFWSCEVPRTQLRPRYHHVGHFAIVSRLRREIKKSGPISNEPKKRITEIR